MIFMIQNPWPLAECNFDKNVTDFNFKDIFFLC